MGLEGTEVALGLKEVHSTGYEDGSEAGWEEVAHNRISGHVC